jgi:hypothetical protein
MTSPFNIFGTAPFGAAAGGTFQSANSTANAPTPAVNNINTASASNGNMNDANSAHHFLSRFVGFDSAKSSDRANDLERRLGGRLASAPAASASRNQEEKKDDCFATSALSATAFNSAPTHDIATLIKTSTSLSQLLSTHHEMCISSALENAQRLQEKRLETRHEERDASDWEADRSMILAAGSRALIPAAGVSSGAGRTNDVEIIPKPQKVTHLPQLAFHVEAIDRYLNSNKDREATLSLIDALKQGMDATNNTTEGSTLVSDESIHQYSNGLSLIKSIVSANCRSNDSNSTALTNYGANTMTSGGTEDKSVQVARNISSSCHFFATQFRTHMSDVVSQVQLDGSIVNTANDILTPVARDASIFAQVVLGSAAKNGVWAGLFYALRCGDLIAAKSILSGEEVEASVVHLVSLLAEMQGRNNDSIFVSYGTGGVENKATLLLPSQDVVRARRVVNDLYEGVKARFTSLSSSEQTMAHYQAACLAMLGGSESISEASIFESFGLVKTVEDYLYASLWHALHLAQSSNSEVGLKHTCEAVVRLGNLVKEWGPSYFEQEEESDGTAVNAVAMQINAVNRIPRSGGWAYALPLLACQQYGSALAYLAEVGGGLGLMSSAHSAVAMNSAGIDLMDYCAHQSSYSDSSSLFPMLVSSFSSSLQEVDVVAALKYLMLLSGKGKFMKTQVRHFSF